MSRAAAILAAVTFACLTVPGAGQEVNGPSPDPSREADAARPSPFPDFEVFDREAMSRRALQDFGACVATESPQRATALLNSDFTTRAYETGLHDLAVDNNTCLDDGRTRRATLRSANLLFAGALAEHLVEEGAEPVNVQLARAAAKPAAVAFSTSDKAAICLVRSLPDDVARLLATEVDSPEEAAAAGALKPILQRCSPEARIEATDAALRAMLATAAFRSTQDVVEGG